MNPWEIENCDQSSSSRSVFLLRITLKLLMWIPGKGASYRVARGLEFGWTPPLSSDSLLPHQSADMLMCWRAKPARWVQLSTLLNAIVESKFNSLQDISRKLRVEVMLEVLLPCPQMKWHGY